MIAILCADRRSGTFFNNRRQSQDRLLRDDVLREAAGRRLWMDAYAYRQFAPTDPGTIAVDEAFLEKAGPGELCFVEGRPLLPWLDRLEGVILYIWDRSYPADRSLDLALDASPWQLARRTELSGSSHKTITKEVYIR